MSDPSVPKRHVMFVSFDDGYSAALVRALEGLCPAVHAAPFLRTLKRSIESLQPVVVVFDLQAIKTEEHSIFDIMAAVTDAFPNIRKIAVGHQGLPSQVVSAMKAGANDFVDRQASADEIRQAIIRQLRQVRLTPSERPGHALALVSARENEGVSDVAANLAAFLATSGTAGDVLLLDLNLELSTLEIDFDVEITYSVRDALDELLRLDKAALRDVVVRHSSGLYLLPLTTKNRDEEEISPQDLATLIGMLRNYFSVIVVKAGCLRDRYCQSYLVPLFDKVVVVCPQLIGSVRDARTLIAEELREGEHESKFVLAVSQHDANILLTPEQIAARIGFPLIATVPCTRVALANSHNDGAPLVLTSSGGRYGRAIHEMAAHLLVDQTRIEGTQKPKSSGRVFDWMVKVRRVAS
jgi:pilus assembly protein CpaE